MMCTSTELRNDILEVISNAPNLPLTPKPEDLLKLGRPAAEKVNSIFKTLLQPEGHKLGESIQQFVWSFSQDVMHATSREKYLTAKHIMLGIIGLTYLNR